MASEAATGTVSIGRSTGTAYRLLWLAVIFDVLAFGVGFGWDRRWHATHPFEDCFSPPHLFRYSMHFLVTCTLIVAGICAPAVTGALDLYLRTHTP
ncbi:MAG TPA: hypothetical protein VGS17_09530 [Candidatus Limnocylindria bacterium]|nr:hypothetical protein [Candidatus Limnocylindria bacterium]